MENIGKTIGENVARLRTRAGLTQSELAEKAGIPFPTYRGIEYGKSVNPGIDALIAISEALGTSVEELVGNEPSVNPSRAELFFEVSVRLPSLNEDELSAVLSLIENLPSASAPRRSAK
jgi:transcriptional regulator with XRE-family HTH domain